MYTQVLLHHLMATSPESHQLRRISQEIEEAGHQRYRRSSLFFINFNFD
jgi:hypothetical protein